MIGTCVSTCFILLARRATISYMKSTYIRSIFIYVNISSRRFSKHGKFRREVRFTPRQKICPGEIEEFDFGRMRLVPEYDSQVGVFFFAEEQSELGVAKTCRTCGEYESFNYFIVIAIFGGCYFGHKILLLCIKVDIKEAIDASTFI